MASNYGKSMTGKGAGKKQVNPTFSAKAPATGPTNKGKQVNPTAAHDKSQTAVDAHANKKMLNPVSGNAAQKTSKGKAPKFDTKPKAPKAGPVKKLQNAAPATKNEMAPYGPNKAFAAPMTVKRLKAMGY